MSFFYDHSSINESFKNETKINNFFFLYFFFHEQNVYEYNNEQKEKQFNNIYNRFHLLIELILSF
jgi:hypothetical protein